MAITVKKHKREELTEKLIHESIEEVAQNAEMGFEVTELYFPRDIASDVKSGIEKHLEETNTDYSWVILRKEPKQYGGFGFNYFISETMGSQKYYKLKIYS